MNYPNTLRFPGLMLLVIVSAAACTAPTSGLYASLQEARLVTDGDIPNDSGVFGFAVDPQNRLHVAAGSWYVQSDVTWQGLTEESTSPPSTVTGQLPLSGESPLQMSGVVSTDAGLFALLVNPASAQGALYYTSHAQVDALLQEEEPSLEPTIWDSVALDVSSLAFGEVLSGLWGVEDGAGNDLLVLQFRTAPGVSPAQYELASLSPPSDPTSGSFAVAGFGPGEADPASIGSWESVIHDPDGNRLLALNPFGVYASGAGVALGSFSELADLPSLATGEQFSAVAAARNGPDRYLVLGDSTGAIHLSTDGGISWSSSLPFSPREADSSSELELITDGDPDNDPGSGEIRALGVSVLQVQDPDGTDALEDVPVILAAWQGRGLGVLAIPALASGITDAIAVDPPGNYGSAADLRFASVNRLTALNPFDSEDAVIVASTDGNGLWRAAVSVPSDSGETELITVDIDRDDTDELVSAVEWFRE